MFPRFGPFSWSASYIFRVKFENGGARTRRLPIYVEGKRVHIFSETIFISNACTPIPDPPTHFGLPNQGHAITHTKLILAISHASSVQVNSSQFRVRYSFTRCWNTTTIRYSLPPRMCVTVPSIIIFTPADCIEAIMLQYALESN